MRWQCRWQTHQQSNNLLLVISRCVAARDGKAHFESGLFFARSKSDIVCDATPINQWCAVVPDGFYRLAAVRLLSRAMPQVHPLVHRLSEQCGWTIRYVKKYGSQRKTPALSRGWMQSLACVLSLVARWCQRAGCRPAVTHCRNCRDNTLEICKAWLVDCRFKPERVEEERCKSIPNHQTVVGVDAQILPGIVEVG